MNLFKIIFLLLFFIFTAQTHAQTRPQAQTIRARPQTTSTGITTEKKTTVLNFEDELIEGDISSPDLLLILKSKNASYGRLLKLRDHFIPEMNETKYDVLRGSKK